MIKLTDSHGRAVTTIGCGRCSVCKTIQPAENFYADKYRSSGLSSRCKACDRKRLTETLPEQSMVRDLKELMARHPSYRPMIESIADALAA